MNNDPHQKWMDSGGGTGDDRKYSSSLNSFPKSSPKPSSSSLEGKATVNELTDIKWKKNADGTWKKIRVREGWNLSNKEEAPYKVCATCISRGIYLPPLLFMKLFFPKNAARKDQISTYHLKY